MQFMEIRGPSLNLIFVALLIGAIPVTSLADSTVDLDIRTNACVRDAVAADADTRPKGDSSEALYGQLQRCGLFPASLPYSQAPVKTIFDDRPLIASPIPSTELTLLNGQRLRYIMKKNVDGKHVVERIKWENGGPKGKPNPVELFGPGLTEDGQRTIVESLLLDCKMASPIVLDKIDNRIKGWVKEQGALHWKDNGENHQLLFKDLQEKGRVYAENAQFQPSMIHQDFRIFSGDGKAPMQLYIYVGDAEYLYLVDATTKSLVRPPSCDGQKIARLQNALNKLNGQTGGTATVEGRR